MDVTPAQRRSFDRRYRWVVLRALEDLRRAPDLNLDNLTELSKIYEICRDQSIQLALDEQGREARLGGAVGDVLADGAGPDHDDVDLDVLRLGHRPTLAAARATVNRGAGDPAGGRPVRRPAPPRSRPTSRGVARSR